LVKQIAADVAEVVGEQELADLRTAAAHWYDCLAWRRTRSSSCT
jgi:hypothetical protein